MKAFIVLGGRIEKNPLTGKYVPSQMLKLRLDQCYNEFLKNYDDHTIIIVSGGTPHGEPVSEAEIMKNYLINKDITACKIFKEDKSINTIENCLFTYELLTTLYQKKLTLQELHPNYKCDYYGPRGAIPRFNKICIITSDFHLPRSKIIFETYNYNNLLLNFVPAPTPQNISPHYFENEEFLLSMV